MRKSTPEPISDVLKSVVERLEQTRKGKTGKLLSAWRAVVGKELAQHARPRGIKRNNLFVIVEDSAWFYQANLKKDSILRALKQKKGLEKLEKISFRIGKI